MTPTDRPHRTIEDLNLQRDFWYGFRIACRILGLALVLFAATANDAFAPYPLVLALVGLGTLLVILS